MSIQEETKNLKQQNKNETLQATTENKDQQMEPKHKMRVGHIEYNGPLPIPSHLKAYNDIVPGAENGKGITRLVSLASALAMLAGAFIYNNRDKNGPEEP